MHRLGILGSGKGSNMVAIAKAIQNHTLPDTKIEIVIADNPDAGILEHASALGIHAEYICAGTSKSRLDGQAEQNYIEALNRANVDLVVLAGFMRIIKPAFLAAFDGRIINIHPSLLPAFKGLRAWEQALEAGVKTAGCTVHMVNADVDSGRIIKQAAVDVAPEDTAESLHAKIQEAEHIIYPQAIRTVLCGH